MNNVTIPNLPANEQGFQLDTGEYVAVSIRRTTAVVNPAFATFAVQARMVDNATGDTLKVGETPVVGPLHSVNLPMAQVSDDVSTLQFTLAAVVQQRAEGIRGFKAALTAVLAFQPPAAPVEPPVEEPAS